MPLNRRVCLAIALLACVTAARAQEAPSYVKRPIAAVRATAPPAIDGDLADAAWQQASRAETFIDPRRGTVVAEQTTAWICYDDDAIYVAFRCVDTRPDLIVARETVRDYRYTSHDSADDGVEVTLDPFGTHQEDDFSEFSVNPIGTPSARISGGRAAKAEWKGDWAAAARRTPDGWVAEMRIPWGILNYPTSTKPQNFGINFSRWHARPKLASKWSNTGPQDFNEFDGIWTDVQVPQTAFKPTLSLLPYALATVSEKHSGLRSGLDARYSLTPEMTLVGSVNPDFATIEGAIEGIAFTRAERYIAEKRPFFLEGRDYLDMGDDYVLGRFFYPRRIGPFDVGAKAYGKLTPVDTLGFLHTADFDRVYNTVARWEHTFGPAAFSRLFVSNRAEAGRDNTVAAAMGRKRWGKFGIEGTGALSSGVDAGEGAAALEAYYSDKGRFTSLRVVNVDPRFNAALGYIPWVDRRGIYAYHSWSERWNTGPFREMYLDFAPMIDWHTDGTPFRRSVGSWFYGVLRSDTALNFGLEHTRFEEETDSTASAGITFNASNRFRRMSLSTTQGRIAGRSYAFYQAGFSLRVLRRLDISYGGGIQQYDGTDEQHIVTASYELSPTRSFGGRAVLQGSDLNWYLSYRSAGALGAELFVMLGDPNAPRFVNQLAVKCVVPF